MNMYQLYCIFFHSSTFVSSITVKYFTMTAELVGISLEVTIIFLLLVWLWLYFQLTSL